MVAIKIRGLTAAQNEALANVSIGDLILLNHYQPGPYSASSSDSESDDGYDSESDEEGYDGEDEDGDSDGEVARPEDQGVALEHQDVPGPGSARPTIEPVPTTAQRIVEHASTVASAQFNARTTNDIANGDRAEHIEDVSRVQPAAHVKTERELRREARNAIWSVARHMSLVTRITKDDSDTITEIYAVVLRYRVRPDDRARSYQLYGTQCVANMPFQLNSVTGLSTEGFPLSAFRKMPEVTFNVNPNADDVRDELWNSVCPARCDEGILHSINELHGMVKDYTIPTSRTNAWTICPSCIGIDLMKEHQTLCAELENFLQVTDLTRVLDFFGRLNPRRAALEYEFDQFDEREWNYLFDDMLSPENEGGASVDNVEFEPWNEANDPNGGVVPRPAPQATIDSLQVMKYAEVKVDDGAQCPVCCEKFKDDQLIVKLPCKHIFCEGGCILEWLKNDDSCPLCRAKVSPEGEGETEVEGQAERQGEDQGEGEAADSVQEDDESAHVNEPEKAAHLSMPGAYTW